MRKILGDLWTGAAVMLGVLFILAACFGPVGLIMSWSHSYDDWPHRVGGIILMLCWVGAWGWSLVGVLYRKLSEPERTTNNPTTPWF